MLDPQLVLGFVMGAGTVAIVDRIVQWFARYSTVKAHGRGSA